MLILTHTNDSSLSFQVSTKLLPKKWSNVELEKKYAFTELMKTKMGAFFLTVSVFFPLFEYTVSQVYPILIRSSYVHFCLFILSNGVLGIYSDFIEKFSLQFTRCFRRRKNYTNKISYSIYFLLTSQDYGSPSLLLKLLCFSEV